MHLKFVYNESERHGTARDLQHSIPVYYVKYAGQYKEITQSNKGHRKQSFL